METKNYIYDGEKFLISSPNKRGQIAINYKGENTYVTTIPKRSDTNDYRYHSLTTGLSYRTVEEAVNATCDYLLKDDQYLQERKKELNDFFKGIGNEEI